MMPPTGATVWKWALAIYWVALMVATHWPGAQVNVIPGLRLDLLIHIGAYAGLAGLMAFAGVGAAWRPGRAVLLIVGLTALLALLDEGTQAIPAVRRTFDPDDLIADLVGAVLGAAVGVAITRRRAPPESRPTI
jgi:VanZ family protein